MNTDGSADGGDACDEDDDDDGILDAIDNCPFTSNPSQRNVHPDLNPLGDACSPDDDEDGVPDHLDNCPSHPNLDKTTSMTTPW